MPKLRNWCFANGTNKPVKPEIVEGNELEQTRLLGYVYDDSRRSAGEFGWGGGEFENGHRIVTSPVREINLEEGYVKTRSGTKYELEGTMNEKYQEWLGSDEEGCIWDMLPRLLN